MREVPLREVPLEPAVREIPVDALAFEVPLDIAFEVQPGIELAA
ncbi:hypothetical protein [Longispora albida]|nr:hypothetical protein [Longispora albida]